MRLLNRAHLWKQPCECCVGAVTVRVHCAFQCSDREDCSCSTQDEVSTSHRATSDPGSGFYPHLPCGPGILLTQSQIIEHEFQSPFRKFCVLTLFWSKQHLIKWQMIELILGQRLVSASVGFLIFYDEKVITVWLLQYMLECVYVCMHVCVCAWVRFISMCACVCHNVYVCCDCLVVYLFVLCSIPLAKHF